MKAVAFLVAFFGILQLGHTQSRLQLQSGMKTVGGTIQLPLEYSKSDLLTLGIDLSPELGYFIANGWLLSVGPTFTNRTVYSSDLSQLNNGPYRWGAHIKIRYFFDTGSAFYPFVGFGAGLLTNNFTVITMRWVFEVPMGIIWAVSNNIGIQVAAPLSFEGGPLGTFEKIRFSPGYLGVIAFF